MEAVKAFNNEVCWKPSHRSEPIEITINGVLYAFSVAGMLTLASSRGEEGSLTQGRCLCTTITAIALTLFAGYLNRTPLTTVMRIMWLLTHTVRKLPVNEAISPTD